MSGEIIDQVAATVDSQVITSSQIDAEIRVTAFLNGDKPDFSGPSRRQTAGRLIDQLLVAREMVLTRFAGPAPSEIQATLKQIQARAGSPDAFRRALADYRITEAQLTDALRRQAALVRFIDLRFRPEIQVQDSDIQQYYENVYLPAARKKGIRPDPSFDDARDECEEAVASQMADQRAEVWLKEARARARITYEEDAFQ